MTAAKTLPKTAAQRKAEERKRHKEAGRVPVTVHVQPEYRDEVRELEAKLQRREKRKLRPAPDIDPAHEAFYGGIAAKKSAFTVNEVKKRFVKRK